MATYTTNYTFALPVPNSSDDANTWGSTLNTDTFTRMDTYLLATALSNIGATAPTVPAGSPRAGQYWIDNASQAPNLVINMYSGSAWVPLGILNTVNNSYTPSNAAVPTQDGQIVIGATGGSPAANTLTAGAGITITNSANNITIGATSSGGVNVVTFTTNGTYIPSDNLTYAIIECMGGGDGGSRGVGQSGGYGGKYSRSIFAASAISGSQTVTIGAGGVGVSGSAATTGGISSVGSLCSSIAGNIVTLPGATPGVGISSLTPGTTTIYYYTTGMGGAGYNGAGGGISSYGTGMFGVTVNGNNATSYGGGGASCLSNSSSGTGGNGYSGIVIITEYIG